MIIKVILAVVLLVAVIGQCLLIYWLGGYNPTELNKLLSLWQSFGIELTSYTTFVLSISQSALMWLAPMLSLLVGMWTIIKQNLVWAVLAVVGAFLLMAMLAWAVYNPQMMVSM